jgi:Na+-driven multidrug efflux pump
MQAETAPRPETATHIISLTRFAILCTLGMAAALLVADFVGRGWSNEVLRFLSEKVVVTLVCGIAAQVVVAIAAVTSLALWKS